MTTENAQRRLLEALAHQNSTPGGIQGLLLGMPLAIQTAHDVEMPELADVWQAFTDLASAVLADLTEEHV